jgi:hypothetical protein
MLTDLSTPVLPSGTILPRLSEVHTYGGEERSAFVRSKQERNLRITLDLDSLAPSEALDMLLELGRHDEIDLTTTQPAGFSTVTVGSTVVSGDQVEVITEAPNGNKSLTGVWPASQWLRFAEEEARARDLDPAETRRRYLLAGAEFGRADCLAFQNAMLGRGGANKANPMTVDQAAALTGLFLRSRGHDEVQMWDRGNFRIGFGWQYFVAARMRLWAGWRWWSACVAAGQLSAGESAMATAQAVLDRFPRCIRARDEVLYRTLVPAGKGDHEGILYHLDALLLVLSGTIDATALIANVAHSVGADAHQVGWRRRQWRQQLATAAPLLHNLTDSGTPTRAVIDLVAEIRNTIHGAPLSGVHFHAGSEQMHLVALPPRAATEIQPCADALGGLDHWGIRPTDGGRILLDPHRFVQVVLPFVGEALNAIMEATEVEQLPGVDPAKLSTGPPPDHVFEPTRAHRICLLLGLAA